MEEDVRSLGCLLTISILLGGCASVPMAGPTADADGKRFDPPASGQSALYLYRSSLLGSEVAFTIADNGQAIATLANKTWVRVEVPPGQHVITCAAPSHAPLTQTPAQAATVYLAPGETRFLEVDVWPGLPLNPRCQATEVPADQGRAGVAGGNRTIASSS